MMLTICGSAALSAFRLEKILIELKSSAPRISHFYAEFVHFGWFDNSAGRLELDAMPSSKYLTLVTVALAGALGCGRDRPAAVPPPPPPVVAALDGWCAKLPRPANAALPIAPVTSDWLASTSAKTPGAA